MAKDRKKLQHIHSSIPDKQPTPASLEVGEIAVNNAKEQEFLSIKNSNDKVVRFSSDGQIISWIERKEVMPYKGYVRGDGGPAVTSGDTPTPDAKGSYGISNDDLLNNKSELVFKLNQVAADLTTKHDKVNGAKDMYNKEVNPTDDYGVNDGAGFFIDMSRYAMRDGNPSFSGLSATCRTELSGNTFIKDGANTNPYGTDSGHTFYILTTDVSAHNKTWKEEISAKIEDISGRTTTIGNNGENLHVMGTTTEVHDGNVTITNKSNVTENTSGTSTSNIVVDNIVNVSGETHITTTGNTAIHTESKLGITAVDDILESSEADITITANSDICETAGGKASFYGVAQTNLGLDCADSTPSVVTNLYGDTINTDADTANTTIGTAITQVTSANTNISTATTVIGTADTKITSAKTVINTANTSATTATLSGNTLQIRESGYIDYSGNTLTSYTTSKTCIQANTDLNMGGNTNTRIGYNCAGTSGYSDNVLVSASSSANTYAPNVVISGTNLDIKEDVTKISSCSKIEIETNDLSISTCTGGTAEFNFCSGFTLNSDNIKMQECTNGSGSIMIQETNTTISGTNLSVNESGDTTFNVGDDFSVNASGDTTVLTTGNTTFITSGETKIITEDGTTIQTTAGDTNINTSGNTNVTSTENICAVADQTGAFKGTVKTNIGKDCSDAGQTATLNLNGDTINESGNNITEISSEKTCIHAGTDLNMGGDTNTRVGYDCNGGSGYTNNTYISASNSAFTYSPNIGISGSNLDISGATTIDISGGTITEVSTGKTCIHADTDLNMGGDTNTRIGYDCNGGSGYTNNTYISASSSAFTYAPNIGISGSNLDISGATTIDISGGTITEISTGKTCIHAGTDLNMGGDVNTKIGYKCNGDSGYTNNTYISASSSAITYAPNIQISGNTTEITGTSNVYVYGDDICVSGVTEASLGAKSVKVGTNCTGTTVATGITGISTDNITLSSKTINESGTTEVNIYGGNNVNINSKDVCVVGTDEASIGGKDVKIGTNCTGTTIATGISAFSTDNVTVTSSTINITGTSNTNVYGGDVCISGGSEASMGAQTVKIGTNCTGGTIATGITATSTNNINIESNDICISGGSEASLGANEVKVGTNCNGTTIATGISAFSTNNVTITSSTINITGDSQTNIYGGDVCISGGSEASLGAETVKIGTDCGTNTIATGVTINATTSVTINAPTTIITGDTYISGETTINKELHLIKGLNKPLNWVYDNVCNHDSGTTVFAENSSDASRTITIPSSAAHIKRETLSWTYGSVTNASGSSYDPGSNSSTSCTQNSDSSKFIIPKTISDVTDGTVTLDTCLNVDTDICVTGKVSAANGFFQTSDRNAKENIDKPSHEKLAGAHDTPIMKFNYKDDETHRDVYGVIAQEAEANGLTEVVYTDENDKKSVDYTSLMILKIAYLENDNAILRQQLAELYQRVKKLEENK